MYTSRGRARIRIAVEADEPGRTVSVTVERPKETISPKLGLIESGPLTVVLTVGGLVGEEEWAWLYARSNCQMLWMRR